MKLILGCRCQLMYDIFFVSKKVVNQIKWEKFHEKYPSSIKIDNVKNIDDLKSKSFTRMFWIVWDDLTLDDSFDLTKYKATKWDNMYVHVFKNKDYYDGICLFPKHLTVTQREFDHRFFIEKKEIDLKISNPDNYDLYKLAEYDEYISAIEASKTDMFWCIWPEVTLIDEKILNLYFSHHNSYDRNENHVFKNSCDGKDSYFNGIVLFSKNKPISKREFDRRYLIDKKEHDLIASKYQYPIYVLCDYEQYLEILEKNQEAMFWGLWPEIEIFNDSIFDLYFDPRDGKYDYDRNENHSFKHIFRNQETYSNGVVLFSKNKKIGRREFDHRFLIEKKEHPDVVSKFKPYDIVFISYDEPNADENYKILLSRFSRAKRVHKVKGIHQAHIKAAEIVETEMFWVVDGDAVVDENFLFDHETSTYERDIVHVWRSQNPINDLVYGYGGVKLLPRKLTLDLDINSADMTTAISKRFKPMPQISNVTAFNTDPFNTWKSAFRECVKLSSRLIDRQKEDETNERLDIWCTAGEDRLFGNYAISGAKLGRSYGNKHKTEPENLKLINDFSWLKKLFEENQ
jgi:hypothetical protein